MAQRSSMRLSTWSLIFFKRRFPEHYMFTTANETEDDDVQNLSWAYDWIKSLQQQTCRSMSIRVCPCLDCGMTFLKGSASCVRSKALCIALSKAWICSSRWTCVKNV
jgi:hypothetical protein